MSTKLEVLRDLSASLGFVREIEQVPAELDCPIHEIPLVEHHVETIAGWQAIRVCADADDVCGYHLDAEPMQIEPPDGTAGDKKPAPTSSKATSRGGF